MVRNKTIPRFEPGFKFDVANARFDRIFVSIQLGSVLTANLANVHNIFKLIARNSDMLRNNGTEGKPELIVRSDKWLFGGRIIVAKHEERGSATITAYLEINPVRYFANHAKSRARERGTEQHIRKESLRLNTEISANISDQTLDGNDNYIINARLIEASRLDWSSYTISLIKTIADVLKDELSSSDRRAMIYTHPNIVKWAISQIEIHWEYSHTNATAAVQDFGRKANGYFTRLKRKLYPGHETIERAAVSYTFNTNRKKLMALVYSKAGDRVRIECKFNGNPRSIFSGDKRYNLSRYTSNDIEILSSFLPTIVRAAKNQLSPILEVMRTLLPVRPPNMQRLSQEFITILNDASYDPMVLEKILYALYFTGKISENLDPQYNKKLARLVNRGFLASRGRKERGKAREYILTGELRKAFLWAN